MVRVSLSAVANCVVKVVFGEMIRSGWRVPVRSVKAFCRESVKMKVPATNATARMIERPVRASLNL